MGVAPTAVENVLVERQDAVVRLFLNRFPLNVLDLGTIREVKAKLDKEVCVEGVRLVEIWRGQLAKAFSAGTEIREHLREHAPEMLREFHALIRSVLYAPRPTLAVVEGHCLGGGMELAMACDFIVASANAQFGLPEINLGCFPPVASVLLSRLIPEKRALEMILTGKWITAREAFDLGLVNRVANRPDLQKEVEKFRQGILGKSPRVVALARRAVRLGSREAFESGLREAERIYLDELLQTEDAEEGLRAYLEKREPKFEN